jgi:hypothetical protein
MPRKVPRLQPGPKKFPFYWLLFSQGSKEAVKKTSKTVKNRVLKKTVKSGQNPAVTVQPGS